MKTWIRARALGAAGIFGSGARRARVALAGVAVATMHRAGCQIAPECGGDHLAKLERRTGGRVDLVAMVRFDDFDVVAVAEGARRHLRQPRGNRKGQRFAL